ncbi:glycosyltransferase family 2 protein [Methylotenera sp.]|uniref:glycosyltransferase family 2 protein n=1 Tax=Methylotenera sp. TaxID=2051956 RepID=UPI0027352DD2|nr:glycosyltransferase family 2 protein [Methylotenera sp.]MDP3211525.1 glycosyltransferase family 2 protein [Methylotenera sp.]
MISVCIATYNASKYINSQVISILDQLSPEDEVIVSDDVSTDGTVDEILKINDPRIKVIKGNSRLGVIKNFERSLYAAKGELIFLSDQDDIWLPNKISLCKVQLDRFLLVVTDCVVVDANLYSLSPSFFALKKSRKGIIRNIYRNSYIGCCIAFRRELLDIALPFPVGIPMHDLWLGILAEIKGDVAFLPNKLLLYRRHGNNLSGLDSHFSIIKKIRMRIFLIFNLCTRIMWICLMRALKFIKST